MRIKEGRKYCDNITDENSNENNALEYIGNFVHY